MRSTPVAGGVGFDLQAYCRAGGHRTNDLVVYLASWIDSPKTQNAELRLGSEDGVKVWLNGKLLHRNFVRRQAAPGQDRVKLALQQGQNTLVVKLEQINAGGALLASLHSPAKVRVTNQPTAKTKPKPRPAPKERSGVILPDANGRLRLLASSAEIVGEQGEGKIGIYEKQQCIGWWKQQSEKVVWQVKAERRGVYDGAGS